MHENQLTYIDGSKPADHAYAAINWASMTAADVVVFNSEFHRRSWFTALRTWLGTFVDYPHDAVIDRVESESIVVPVGVDLERLATGCDHSDPSVILWNHRADADKAPQVFVAALLELDASRHDFRVAIAGERFVDSGDVFDPLVAALGDRVVFNGFADDETYRDLLCRAEIVVSTAKQEFFGVSLTEAVYSGAFPVVPHRLVFPERIPEEFHERCLYRPDGLAPALAWALDNPQERSVVAQRLSDLMAVYDWGVVGSQLDSVLDEMAT